TWKAWSGLQRNIQPFNVWLRGFSLLLVVDAAVSASWALGHPVTRRQAFAVAYVLMAATAVLTYWVETRLLYALPPSPL
ncbi:MAG: hypothetical protein QOI63_1974, partial [Thermoplasmata archaeon]|nr:hypothetical protein [Thermoplasmata archaeon]